ncbi:MAG TPA: gephyrin-like molybdotransferase Glp, partial [Thermomicrobiales bacterium]|nr:gephyrin-like molybdotransferase Glp [Thermomicrobiales bacterium]
TILRHVRPMPVERLPLAAAAGRMLADDLQAAADQPPFAAATMDGFAVVAEDGSPWREVIGEQTAGFVLAAEVTPGTAIRITTGSPVPRGANAVIKVEATEPAEDHVVILQEDVAPGENIRPIGADLRQGDVVVSRGTQLGPAALGLAAGLGVSPVPVARRPRVSILSTGDELVEPGEPIEPGKIYDANRFSLIAAAADAGTEVVWAGKAPDERAALRQLLIDRIAASDVVLTSGGVSMGELDLIKPLLGELATVHFRRVFMKPGKPFNFATSGATLLFGLPGNPVSALVAFEVFIRPALLTAMGAARIERPRAPVTLRRDAAPTDRIEFQRGVVSVAADGRLVARTTGVQASSRLASFLGANALLIVPPRETTYRAGEVVEAMLLAPPLATEPE